jgi:hypothetical protein
MSKQKIPATAWRSICADLFRKGGQIYFMGKNISKISRLSNPPS